MWVTFVIAGGFFAACIAVGYFGIQEQEQREREAASKLASAPAAQPGSCDAPLRRPATSDEVVFELEQRIDAELRDIAHALHSPPESLGRVLRA